VKPDTSIIAAVELDDASHARAKRQAADARKAHALKSAGIPLVRFRVKHMPDVPSIQAAFAQASGEPT
jgi:very-short-patch-repair endonuclease